LFESFAYGRASSLQPNDIASGGLLAKKVLAAFRQRWKPPVAWCDAQFRRVILAQAENVVRESHWSSRLSRVQRLRRIRAAATLAPDSVRSVGVHRVLARLVFGPSLLGRIGRAFSAS